MTMGLTGYDGPIERDHPIGPLTTYRFGGPAAFYAEVPDAEALRSVLGAGRAEGLPLLILGRGSNVVISDRGFEGLVVRLSGAFLAIEMDDHTATAGAAASLPRLARETVGNGRGGLEWCVGIPGSVGGAVRMNAGGHGSDTAEWHVSARVLDARTLAITDMTVADLDLRYRHSALTDAQVVTSATFRTTSQERAVGEEKLREITRWRREHQPGGTFNAGSVFKNPAGDAAGRLIDEVGLKGFRIGGAMVSHRHANFFEADRTASAQDVFDLVAEVARRVAAATGVQLEPEIRFVGEFERSGGRR
ncbi:MAG: UDP-N-acetylmuramate dehydrogenase [Thermoanaerobaculia bacterium]|nr:UDP-N-acetylmuramate dehydrogenase [Thermoanaerobaculia bacterium]